MAKRWAASAFSCGTDVERVSAEIGYWLGEPFWGRGIATEALVALTDHAIATHGLTRVFAVPFAWNTASCRVLEKAGYVLEGAVAAERGEGRDGHRSAAVRVHSLTFSSLSVSSVDTSNRRNRS